MLAGDDASAFRAAVKTIFDAYSDANVKEDIDGYLALWDEEGIKMSPNRPAIYGKPAISGLKHKKYKKVEYLSQNIKIEEVQSAGDFGFAFGTVTTSFRPKDGGEAINANPNTESGNLIEAPLFRLWGFHKESFIMRFFRQAGRRWRIT